MNSQETTPTSGAKKTSSRLLALDVLRGITIAGMIMVNNPGSWGSIYAPLEHAEWIGLTPTDLVFPFFMFIMGISTYISLRKYNFEFSFAAIWKILKRTIVIFAIGLGISYLSLSWRTLDPLPFDQLRILGVMQRLALSYGATAIIALTMKHKHIPYLIGTLFIGYFLILFFGNGFEYNETNILSLVDRLVLGMNHMYKDNGIDPEGLLSTIPSIAHVLIGFCCGKLLMEVKDIHEKIERLFLIGTILTFTGFLLSYGCPISKKIWSPTFAITTCGLAASLLALLVWFIDVKGYKKWSRFFESFGVNPLFIYVMAAILSISLSNISFAYGNEAISLHGYAYSVILQPLLGDKAGSLAFALLFVALNWTIGHVLYKKKLYIKI
jgi:predicted acyltransferase